MFWRSGELLWVDRSGGVEVLRSCGFAGHQVGAGESGHEKSNCGLERHDCFLVTGCVVLSHGIVSPSVLYMFVAIVV